MSKKPQHLPEDASEQPTQPTHPFDRLVASTEDLLSRFEAQQSTTQAALNVLEEAQEVAEAAADNDSHALREELVDVIVTTISTAIAAGIRTTDLHAAMHRVAAKNNAKTWQTHGLHPETGKITRRSDLP